MNFESLLDRIGAVLYHLAGMLFLALTSCMTIQIGLRYLANTSLPWMEELNRFFMVWLGFVGAAACSYRGRHIRFGMDLIGMYSVAASRRVMLVILAAFNIFLIILAIVGARTAFENMNVFCAALPIRYGYILLVVPVASILMLFFHSRDFYRLWQQKRGA